MKDNSFVVQGSANFASGASVFPTHTFNNANYWVDVVFAETIVDTTLAISNINVTVVDGSSSQIKAETVSGDMTLDLDVSLLTKPFKLEQLARKVAEVLNR